MSKEVKFSLMPRRYIDRGMRQPTPTARIQRPYRRQKPRVMKNRHEIYYRGSVLIKTVQPIKSEIVAIDILQNDDRVIVTLQFKDRTQVRL